MTREIGVEETQRSKRVRQDIPDPQPPCNINGDTRNVSFGPIAWTLQAMRVLQSPLRHTPRLVLQVCRAGRAQGGSADQTVLVGVQRLQPEELLCPPHAMRPRLRPKAGLQHRTRGMKPHQWIENATTPVRPWHPAGPTRFQASGGPEPLCTCLYCLIR